MSTWGRSYDSRSSLSGAFKEESRHAALAGGFATSTANQLTALRGALASAHRKAIILEAQVAALTDAQAHSQARSGVA